MSGSNINKPSSGPKENSSDQGGDKKPSPVDTAKEKVRDKVHDTLKK